MVPQLLYLGLMLLELGIALGKHGEPRTGKHSFFRSTFGFALISTILYYGGFFNCFFK